MRRGDDSDDRFLFSTQQMRFQSTLRAEPLSYRQAQQTLLYPSTLSRSQPKPHPIPPHLTSPHLPLNPKHISNSPQYITILLNPPSASISSPTTTDNFADDIQSDRITARAHLTELPPAAEAARKPPLFAPLIYIFSRNPPSPFTSASIECQLGKKTHVQPTGHGTA